MTMVKIFGDEFLPVHIKNNIFKPYLLSEPLLTDPSTLQYFCLNMTQFDDIFISTNDNINLHSSSHMQ